MIAIRSAVGLLTRLPAGRGTETSLTSGAAAFPLVGAAIGALGGIICLVVGGSEPTIAACLAIAAMALVAGGLHLDGLADTVDALLAPDPSRAETARRDPRIGAGGAAALVLVLGTQVAALASLDGTAPLLAAATLVLAAAAARAVPVVGVVAARLAGLGQAAVDTPAADTVGAAPSTASGFGAWFTSTIRFGDGVVALGTLVGLVVGVAVLAGQPGLLVGVAVGFVVGLGTLRAIDLRRGGLDGDGFGATIEITVTAVLVAVALVS